MKSLSFSALLLLIILTTGSCKKIPIVHSLTSHISFKVDGVPKEGKGIKNVIALELTNQKVITITGNLDAKGDISILINNFRGVGEYSGEDDFVAIYNTPEIEESFIGTGKIKITEFVKGKSIKGEFQFKGERAVIHIGNGDEPPEFKIFSDGKFEAKITEYDGPLIEPD